MCETAQEKESESTRQQLFRYRYGLKLFKLTLLLLAYEVALTQLQCDEVAKTVSNVFIVVVVVGLCLCA